MEIASRRERRRARLIGSAERARDAFGLVLLLVLLTYVIASLVNNEGWEAALLTVVTCATAVVALVSAHAKERVVRRGLAVGLFAVLLSVVSAITDGRPWLNLASFLVLCLLVVAMAAVLQRVVTAREVSSRTILGALSVYASLGILFTWAYGTINRIEGGGFFGKGVETAGSDFLFFSYTTLTTTGYGDLVPAGQVGRMISGLEMMIGQIFLVTLVAGLVSLWKPGESILRRRERRDASGSDAAEDSGIA